MTPKYTVVTNIISPESNKWVGTSWEFFDDYICAEDCYNRHIRLGNCPTMRPYFNTDKNHLGAVHLGRFAGYILDIFK